MIGLADAEPAGQISYGRLRMRESRLSLWQDCGSRSFFWDPGFAQAVNDAVPSGDRTRIVARYVGAITGDAESRVDCESHSSLGAGAAARPASKVRRESALDVFVTVPPSGYRRECGRATLQPQRFRAARQSDLVEHPRHLVFFPGEAQRTGAKLRPSARAR
jgi:hypothetical protein